MTLCHVPSLALTWESVRRRSSEPRSQRTVRWELIICNGTNYSDFIALQRYGNTVSVVTWGWKNVQNLAEEIFNCIFLSNVIFFSDLFWFKLHWSVLIEAVQTTWALPLKKQCIAEDVTNDMPSSGARPTNGISIEFEIRPKFAVLWFEIYSADHNEILHTSRQLHCRDVCKILLWSV